MKFSHLAGIVALVVITLVVFFIQTDSPTVQDETATFLVTAFLNDVFIKRAGVEDFNKVPVETGVETREGATIKTSETGRAIVESTDNIVTVVDRNSEYIVEIFQNGGERISIRLISGNLWSRIEKILEQGESYEVRTKNTVAVVRGTSFGTTYIDGITTYIVIDGEVIVSIVDPNTNEIIPESQQTIRSGERIVLEKESVELVISKVTKADRESEWIIFNSQERNVVPVSEDESISKDIGSTNDINIQDILIEIPSLEIKETKIEILQPKIEPKLEVREPEPKITEPTIIEQEIVESTALESKIEVEMLVFKTLYFPLSQFDVHSNDTCPHEHYHTNKRDNIAYAIDDPRSIVVVTMQSSDPSGCGYGVVKDTLIETMTLGSEQVKAFGEYIQLQ